MLLQLSIVFLFCFKAYKRRICGVFGIGVIFRLYLSLVHSSFAISAFNDSISSVLCREFPMFVDYDLLIYNRSIR
jgi:uncharacterized membrane protein